MFFINGPQALYVNPSCLKGISGINLSPANQKLFTTSFILYSLNKRGNFKFSLSPSENVGKYEFLTEKDVLPEIDLLQKAAKTKIFE